MPKKKNKLWVKIDEIVQTSMTFLSRRFQVKLSGTGKLVWVRLNDLSKGVATHYEQHKKVPNQAKARVNRVHYDKQQEYFDKKQVRGRRQWVANGSSEMG